MIEDLLDDAKRRMDKSVDATANEFNTIRTGRASAALLDRVKVDYYGTETPLNQHVKRGELLTFRQRPCTHARETARIHPAAVG